MDSNTHSTPAGPGRPAGLATVAAGLDQLAAQALTNGDISGAHAQVLAQGTRDLPAQVAAEAEPVLLDTARRLDPRRLRHAVAHLVAVADPDGADTARERRHQRRRLCPPRQRPPPALVRAPSRSSAGPITGPSMKAAGDCSQIPMAASPPPRRTEDPAPRPDRGGLAGTA